MLRFQTQTCALTVDAPALPGDRPVEEVAGIELHAWLCRADFDRSAADRIFQTRCRCQRTRPDLIDYPVVIIAPPEAKLLVRLPNARADGGRLPKVERRARNRGDLPGRNQRRIDRRKCRCSEPQHMIENGALTAVQVPIGVLREIERRRL